MRIEKIKIRFTKNLSLMAALAFQNRYRSSHYEQMRYLQWLCNQ